VTSHDYDVTLRSTLLGDEIGGGVGVEVGWGGGGVGWRWRWGGVEVGRRWGGGR
jgi:hypothetical protein